MIFSKDIAVTQFEGILPPLSDALVKKGYTELTPVQLDVSDPALAESDLLVSAQTGSGKTVAFGLAIAPTILGDALRFERADAPLTLIVAPTRELALQVRREFEWLYAETGARIASCVGGMDMRTERRELDQGAHIVVGTPGRLRDHIARKSLRMDQMRAIVLDEADEMLDLGFRDDLEFILGEAPEERRTLMFSATVPRQIADLARNFQKDAKRVATASEAKQHVDIDYQALVCAAPDRENAIINLLRFHEPETAIVFCGTRVTVNHLTARFTNRGFRVVALSGELSQAERSHALQAMRDGRAQVCVATDVAARGIDLPGLNLVVHADLPQNQEALLHRSGRTGRAGQKGISALIVPKNQRGKAERLLKWAKVTANWGTPPSASDVRAKDDERLIASFKTEEVVGEEAVVAALLEGNTPEQIASAYIAQYRSLRTSPEELREVGGVDAPTENRGFASSVWLSLNVGREQRAEPRWLIPLLCKAGGITKREIGAIKMVPNETYVELDATIADRFFAALGKDNILEEDVKATKLDKVPDVARSGHSGARPSFGDKPRGGPRPDRGPREERAPRSDSHRKPHDGANGYKGNKPEGKYEGKPAGKYEGKKPEGKYEGKPAGKYEGKKPEGKYEGKPAGKYEGKPAGKYAGKPAGKYAGNTDNKPRKPRAEGASGADFKPKFGGSADSGPKRGGPAGKPAGGPKKSGPPAGFDPKDTSQKLRHKATGKGKFAKPRKPVK
ncbi:DEAD/DEAH box helicase [Falsihalocynthiibacter sp. BN13B15]|uniref:DEAD/DEAH box helicase n=1 Tax=Falsihalocynthiibacter sp. BN13B15 TaxID=3240871 RepID=UPI00351020ED